MKISRREFASAAGTALALLSLPGRTEADDQPRKNRLGIVEHSFAIRIAADRAEKGPERIDTPLGFLEHCAKLGAGGIQFSLGTLDRAAAEKLRARADALAMYVEGSVRLPKDEADCARFEAEIQTARAVGARVVRTAALSGRRYETFNSAEAFREFADRAFRSLVLAKPIVARHDVRLAVENHKDWRVDELVAMLKRLDSGHIGVCIDTGNSIALLEDPMEVVEALLPWAFATHLKDMGVEEYPVGFLLSEVPLGEGFLDLTAIVIRLKTAHPEIHLSLEMMTRDPLRIPCLSEKYWATLERVPGQELARTLAMVRAHASKERLPRVGTWPLQEKLEAEETNVRRSVIFAAERLNL